MFTTITKKAVGLLALGSVVGATAASPAVAKPVAPRAAAAASPDPARALGRPAVDPQAVAAVARQKGIAVAEARERLAQEKASGARGARLEKSLGRRSGGSYLDAGGRLVVTTLDTAAKAVVTREGARPKLVDDSSARLDAIVERLDRQAAQSGAGAVQGWYVDVPSNTVVVTVSQGASDARTAAMTKLATSFGDSVRLDRRPADESPRAAEWMVGGYQYNLPTGGSCSVGFNTVDAANRHVVMTAGHCLTAGGWLSRNGYSIGARRTINYPGDDFGTFWNSYPAYWQPSPSVYKYNGTYARVAGQWNNPTVGATVCKSGRTTGYTCGRITALNQTVTYTGGKVLYGLVRHDACVEPGDSGGSNISAGNYALGLTSGASFPATGPYANKCLSKQGRPNVSWYQPIGEALSRSGVRLLL